MYCFFDESGDYAFPRDRFDSYVQAALICPDSQLDVVTTFVDAKKATWSVDELHASQLQSGQLLEIAGFLGAGGCQLLAHVTDSVLVTEQKIADFRLAQAATIGRNLDWYRRESTKARGAPVPEIEEWMLRQLKRAGLSTQISNGEFVQAHYLVALIEAALQKSLLAYAHEAWSDDFHQFRFILDAKLPRKMAAGEKYLNDLIVPVLGSQQGSPLIIPKHWKEAPLHPFIQKFEGDGVIRGVEVKDAINLKAIFGEGLEFKVSTNQAGLQLADTAAFVVRQAVLQPQSDVIQAAYDQLRPKLRNGRGRSLTIHRLDVGEEDRSSLERYETLEGPARIG
jgi:Protein of unknown function (DUF3800)